MKSFSRSTTHPQS